MRREASTASWPRLPSARRYRVDAGTSRAKPSATVATWPRTEAHSVVASDRCRSDAVRSATKCSMSALASPDAGCPRPTRDASVRAVFFNTFEPGHRRFREHGVDRVRGLQRRLERVLQAFGRIAQFLGRLLDFTIVHAARRRGRADGEARGIGGSQLVQAGGEAVPLAGAFEVGWLRRHVPLDVGTLPQHGGDFGARGIPGVEALLQPVDVLLEIVEISLHVDLATGSAEHGLFQLSVELILESIAIVVDPVEELLDVVVAQSL